MLGTDTTRKGGLDGASLKTAPLHQEDHLPPGDNNGYFVRPVAVASIFKPALANVENVPKKSIVPEKRRFSVLAGDLQPCVDTTKPLISNDEFSRRRQSWDIRSSSTVPPFSQDLLKKTPKRTSPSRTLGPSKLAKDNDQTSPLSSSNSVSEEKPYSAINGNCASQNLNDKKQTTIKEQKVNSCDAFQHQNNCLDKDTTVAQNTTTPSCVFKRGSFSIVKTELSQIVEDSQTCLAPISSGATRPRSRASTTTTENETDCGRVRRRSRADRDRVPQVDAERCHHLENGTPEIAKLSNGITTEVYKASSDSHNGGVNNKPSQAAFPSTNDVKPHARVYGVSRNSSSENSNQKTVSSVGPGAITKVTESNKCIEVISNSQKVTTDTSELPKNQSKVYGVAKRNCKIENKTVTENTTSALVVEKKESSNSTFKTPEPEKVEEKSLVTVPSRKHGDTKLENDVDGKKAADIVTLREKSSTHSDSKFVEIPKNVRTARRTSDVIAAKIQSIFSNVSTEKTAIGNSASSAKLELNSTRKAVNKTTTVECNSKDPIVHPSSASPAPQVKQKDTPASIGKEVIDKSLPKTKAVDSKQPVPIPKEDSDKSAQRITETKKTANLVSSDKVLKNTELRENSNKVTPSTKELDKSTVTKNEIENKVSSSKTILTGTTINKSTEVNKNVKCPIKSVEVKESDQVVSSNFRSKPYKVSGNETPLLSASESTAKILDKNVIKSEKESPVKITEQESKVPDNNLASKPLNKNLAFKLPNANLAPFLSQVDAKSNVTEKKLSCSSKTTLNSSTTKVSTDPTTPLNSLLTANKASDYSTKTSVETACPTPPLSQINTKSNDVEKKSSCLKTTAGSSVSKVSADSACQINGPLTAKKALDSSTKTSEETASPTLSHVDIKSTVVEKKLTSALNSSTAKVSAESTCPKNSPLISKKTLNLSTKTSSETASPILSQVDIKSNTEKKLPSSLNPSTAKVSAESTCPKNSPLISKKTLNLSTKTSSETASPTLSQVDIKSNTEKKLPSSLNPSTAKVSADSTCSMNSSLSSKKALNSSMKTSAETASPALSQVDIKSNVVEKKLSSTNSSTAKMPSDSTCPMDSPLVSKKGTDLSTKTSVEAAPPKCPRKTPMIETKSTVTIPEIPNVTKTPVPKSNIVSNTSSTPPVITAKTAIEKQPSAPNVVISANENTTKNIEKCVPKTSEEIKAPVVTEPQNIPANPEIPKQAKESELALPKDVSKPKAVNKMPNKVKPEEALGNGKDIPPNEPSVRPKNTFNKCFNLNMDSFFKSAAKNLDCCTSSPPEPHVPDVKAVSLSNVATTTTTTLPVHLSGNENSMDLMNGSSSSMESLTSESKTPKAPERKRSSLLREVSLPPTPLIPPHSTTVTRTGSLKRYDESKMAIDKPLSILRSPSHSTLPSAYSPHRYSYTEMLSKVCSYGITPSPNASFNPPYKKYSLGSLSSSLSQVAELRSDLLHEQSSSTHTSEVLESETTERMRLEKEVSELQSRYNHVQKKSNKMEMKMMEARVYRSPEINGDISDDDEGNASLYKQKYEKAVQDMEIMKRRVQQQREEEMEQNLLTRKAADKKLAEALEDVEEEKQVANQWKRKAQKLGSELQDLRLMLEEQMARNGELEKKQRGFDAELHSHKEEITKERMLREKALRERDQAQNEKFSLEQELHTTRLDMDEKVILLKQELDELTLSSKGEEEVTLLKRAKQELERKYRDLEEELEEYVDKSNMLETAKVRLEMSLEKLRQEHRRESSVREEEIEELRASFSKKIKNLEAQVESEQEERHQLVKQKHELERRVIELTDQPPPQDPEIERRLRRDLKRTKALLRDAQAMLDRVRDGQGSKSVVRQLKNQLEDVEFAKCSAIKAKQAAEMELQDLQTQLEEVTRNKNDHESRCLQLSREKSALQTQVEEAEEETTEVMNKYEALVARMSTDQKTIAELNQQMADLEAEKNALRDQLSEVNTKFEHLAGQTEDSHRTFKLDAKVRDLDSKLELEQTSRTRLEHQITRLKEQIERLQEECDSLRNKELQAQESTRRFQRQVRDLREDYSALQQKEAEAYRKQHELETALESAEGELKVAKNDLRLACQRIEELKNALEDDLDSGTDVPDDSGSDSDSSLDMSTMMRSSFTPIQRCDSAASDLSFGSRRSVTPSYGDLAALCSRGDVEADINGFSHLEPSRFSPVSSPGQDLEV